MQKRISNWDNKTVNNITKISVFITALVLVFIGAGDVLAASFNDDAQDYATLRVLNYTDFPTGNGNWSTSANADAGEQVSFAIYYHNTSGETATNVRVKLLPQSTTNGTSHSFTAYLWADNASSVSGASIVYISSIQSMNYNSGSVVWRPNQTISGSQALLNGQDGSEIFSSQGLLLGDIASGWSTQGSVIVRYDVSNTQPPPTYQCSDGVDNDGDGLIDYPNDPGCSSSTDNDEYNAPPPTYQCSDGIDNDGDGLIDYGNDPGCSSSTDDNEYNASPPPPPIYQCSDGRDNDGDGLVDYPNDPGCLSSTDNNEYNINPSYLPSIFTNQASLVTQTSATLNGYLDPRDSSGAARWFEWGTDSGNLNNSNYNVAHGAYPAPFDESISNLTPSTVYYFRAVARNSYGVLKGSIELFRTNLKDKEKTFDVVAVTNPVTNIGNTSARINGVGFLDINKPATGWFEWGRNISLGKSTQVKNLARSSSVYFYQSMFGLTSNTTYYYRAVIQDSSGISRGQIVSFKTNYVPVNPPPPEPPKKVRKVDVIKSLENLTFNNGDDIFTSALRGDYIRFTITVQNTGDYELEDIVIRDRIPYFLEFANAEDENMNNPRREVVWLVGDLDVGERTSVTLDMIVTSDAPFNQEIKNSVHVKSNKTEEYSNEVIVKVVDVRDSDGDDDGVDPSSQSAGVFFGTGGMGIWWWLILILLLIVLSFQIYRTFIRKRVK